METQTQKLLYISITIRHTSNKIIVLCFGDKTILNDDKQTKMEKTPICPTRVSYYEMCIN